MQGFLYQKGMGIVEIMVAVIVSMLTALAIYGSINLIVGTNRSMISANSAFNNALAGMYALTSNVEHAGMGFIANENLSCSTFNAYFNGAILANNSVVAPIIITDGGTGSDQITILHADSIHAGASSLILNNMSSADDDVIVNLSALDNNTSGAALLAKADGSLPCTLIGVSSVINNGATLTVAHDSSSQLNPPSIITTYTQPISYQANDLFIYLGALAWNTWRVQNQKLEMLNQMTGEISVVAEDIIAIKAQYGVTNGTQETIDQWVNATGSWQTLDSNEIMRIRAVRIAILARSAQREKTTGGVCTATTSAPTLWPSGPSYDLTGLSNWQCYRYRVISMVIPLKNIVWGSKIS